MAAVFIAIITLINTMCAGLVGVLAGLGAYIGVCGLVNIFHRPCANLC